MKWYYEHILQPIIQMFWRLMDDKRGEFKIKMRSDVPKHEVEAIVRAFYPAIVAFFESEEGRQEYEEWKMKRDKEKAAEKKAMA